MRLLNARTYELTEFHPGQIPNYAILSHTWDREEVLYEDLKYAPSYLTLLYGVKQKRYRSKRGWKKIEYACRQALEDDLSYVWVDTCCIDKTSSAELSEAINSMFLWYQMADCCYVYLADASGRGVFEGFGMSRTPRWFSRGWTLQELIAPKSVIFWSSSWECLGTKVQLRHRLSVLTGIDAQVLQGETDLTSVCVARKMSWAAKRRTTRPEDLAYCLLGIFGISMPPLYGEGEKAFLRLQEEILKTSDDHSLFAWINPDALPWNRYGLLATQPSYFASCTTTVAFRDWTNIIPSTTSNLGISLVLPIFRHSDDSYKALLNCAWDNASRAHTRVCLSLEMNHGSLNQYQRINVQEQDATSWTATANAPIYVRQNPVERSRFDIIPPSRSLCRIDVLSKGGHIGVAAYLHTHGATKSDDWYDALVDQSTDAISGRNSDAFSSDFHIPERPDELAVVLRVRSRVLDGTRGLVEEFFYVLLGSGAKDDFYPATQIMEDKWHVEALSAQKWDETSAILRDAKETRKRPVTSPALHQSEKPSRQHLLRHFDEMAEIFREQPAAIRPSGQYCQSSMRRRIGILWFQYPKTD